MQQQQRVGGPQLRQPQLLLLLVLLPGLLQYSPRPHRQQEVRLPLKPREVSQQRQQVAARLHYSHKHGLLLLLHLLALQLRPHLPTPGHSLSNSNLLQLQQHHHRQQLGQQLPHLLLLLHAQRQPRHPLLLHLNQSSRQILQTSRL